MKAQTGPHAMASIEQIIDDFAYLEEWEDRYRYVIELGKAMPDLSDDKKTAENKVRAAPARSGSSATAAMTAPTP